MQNTNVTGVQLVDARLSSQLTSRTASSGYVICLLGEEWVNIDSAANFSFILKPTALPVSMQRDQQVSFSIAFRPEGNNGRYEDRLEFVFRDLRLNKRFAITRSVVAVVGVQEDYELLKARRPYVRPKRSERVEEPIVEFTAGVPPPAIADFKWAVRLLPYDLPKALKKLLEECEAADLSPTKIAGRIRAVFIPSQLSSTTYARNFSYMLWIEEQRARRDLAAYDMPEATLEPCKGGLYR